MRQIKSYSPLTVERRFTVWQSRVVLLFLIVAGLSIHEFLLIHNHWRMDELLEYEPLQWTLLQIYLIPLGVIIGGIAADLYPGTKRVSWAALLIAAGSCLIWNILLVSCWHGYPNWLGTGHGPADVQRNLEGTASRISVLAVGGLSYFFGKNDARRSG